MSMQVCRGYVDDPRNADNAWVEGHAISFHDESGEVLKLKVCLSIAIKQEYYVVDASNCFVQRDVLFRPVKATRTWHGGN